jgi:hypothetical protein
MVRRRLTHCLVPLYCQVKMHSQCSYYARMDSSSGCASNDVGDLLGVLDSNCVGVARAAT